MSVLKVGIFVDTNHAPAGLLEGLQAAVKLVPGLECVILTPENLKTMEDGTKLVDLFVAWWSDTYAETIGSILITRQEVGLASLFLNQPWVRKRCSAFGTEGEFLRFTFGYPYGGSSLMREPAEDYQLPVFGNWQKRESGKVVFLVPTDAAAAFHGCETAQQWLEEAVAKFNLKPGEYLESWHPVAKHPRSIPMDHALAQASIVYTLQSGGAFKALEWDIPVKADEDDHPIGAFMAAYGIDDPFELDRALLFRTVAAQDVPATSLSIAALMAEALVLHLETAA